MKTTRNFPVYTVSDKAEKSIRAGHPWIYDNEIISFPADHENGCIADVINKKGTYLGSGFISDKSKIRIRLLSSNANETFSDSFFSRRIKYAVDYRMSVMGEDFSCCRLVFGESDGLPGLTVDNYNGLLSVQVLSYGTEKKKDILYKALADNLIANGYKFEGIFERNESQLRTLEGLPQGAGWYEGLPHADMAETVICENGIKYYVDIAQGQKTGFFLDQKYNRLAASRLARGRNVLDCFTHTGSFALNAARAGTRHVTAVDVSEEAISNAKRNAALNGLSDKIDFVCADVFDLLPKLCEKRGEYDYIILDPPAFTKSRKTINDAARGYKEINFRAMKALERGSFLSTCSCSHFMDSELFLKQVSSAACDAGMELKLIEARRQAPDHPTLLNVPETDYLKFFMFQLV